MFKTNTKVSYPADDGRDDLITGFSARRALLFGFFQLFIPASLLLAGIFYAFSSQTQNYELQTSLIREESGLNRVSELTSLVFAQKLSDLMVLAEGEVIRSYLHDKSDKSWIRAAREFSLFARRKPRYSQLRFIDVEGMEILRINNRDGVQEIVPRRDLQDKSNRYYFKDSIKLDQGGIYVSSLDLNIEKGVIEQPIRPTVRFATPVVDGYGVKRGILIINYDAGDFLRHVAEVFTSMYGKTAMLNRDGYWFLGAPEERLWGFMYGSDETFSQQYPDVWAAISSKNKGRYFSGDDIFIFQKTYPLDRSKQGTLENIEKVSLPSERVAGDRYWVFISHLSGDLISDLTSKRIMIALIAYLMLFLVTGVISIFFARNALQKKLAYRQMQQFAATDTLTGLANRRELDKVANREFRRAQRFKRDFSIMMLDLDHFKHINDTYNHMVGDEVLQHVADISKQVVRGQDFMARYGGEEFIILLPETNLSGAGQLGKRICKQVENMHYKEGRTEIPVTISIGVSEIETDDDDYQDIIRRADEALYLAKSQGRNRVVVFDRA